jgi:L-aminopeptidase/D-esterase-like protein
MTSPGSITDVPGIRVGSTQRIGDGWLSGVTVVLPPPGTVGSVDVRGGGPGTHETDALDPTTLVPTVDAVVLTGGSAYGLATAAGAQKWCEEQGRGFAVDGGVVPIVPAAAIFDLGRGGNFTARPDAALGYEAARLAGSSTPGADVGRGNAGAGTGAMLGRATWKGGQGTAAVRLGSDGNVVVGALAVVNAAGLPWQGTPSSAGSGGGNTAPQGPAGLNTTLAVVATNADLTPAECRRTATAAHAGLARALEPVSTLVDGDTIFTLATGQVAAPAAQARVAFLVELQAAAAEAARLAVLDGIASATPVDTPAGSWQPWPGGQTDEAPGDKRP